MKKAVTDQRLDADRCKVHCFRYGGGDTKIVKKAVMD